MIPELGVTSHILFLSLKVNEILDLNGVVLNNLDKILKFVTDVIV